MGEVKKEVQTEQQRKIISIGQGDSLEAQNKNSHLIQ